MNLLTTAKLQISNNLIDPFISLKVITIATLIAFAPAAYSQDDGSADDDAVLEDFGDLLELDEFITTGVSGATKKIKSSVSVSSVNTDDIALAAPRSTAEVFRNIPGIRSEATAGDGNTNIAVRGIPIATGGAKYLQLHEDGLPIMEYGDIAFGTADGFLRADNTIDRIEAIRGGSASTFASNSPGGVINFISKTGEVKGGSLALTSGLDYDSTRVDFEYGSPISDDMRFHVGGFYRVGEGPRNAGYDGNDGGQFKANFTKDFKNGYVRVYFKHLNDKAITYLPMPISVTGSDSNPEIGSLPGYDVRTDTPHTPFLQTNLGIGGDGSRRLSDVSDGLRSITTSVGGELAFDLEGDWKIIDKFRVAANNGRFVSPFPSQIDDAQTIADDIGGAGATIAYANGPNAGETISNPGTLNGNGLIMRTHLFDTELNDFDNYSNDFKIAKSVDLGDGATMNFTFGYYKSRQNIDMDWLWNTYLLEVKGQDAALLDIFDSSGAPITENGLVAYGVPFWGNCCQRSYDASYDTDAPYFELGYQKNKLNFDFSLRVDYGSANGTYAGGTQSADLDVNQDGVISVPEQSVSVINNAAQSPINYSWDYVSYSFGANYEITDDLAVFGRYSRGGRSNADRLLFSDNIRSDGSIEGQESAVDFVKQLEGGVKFRTRNSDQGNLSVFATGFFAKTEEQNFEATTQKFIDRVFEAFGLELEAAYRIGGFSLRAGLTWTNAEIVDDTINDSVIGNTPRRQADLIYQFTPSYSQGRFTVGTNIIGTTDSYAQDSNDLVMPGYAIVNPFINYEITNGLSLSLNVNNVFDAFGLSESEQGSIPGNNVIAARGINGRTTSVTLMYRF